MPIASNGKADPVFQCKLTVWNPDCRYTVEEIAERLELEPPMERQKPGRKAATIDRNS
jgi:hypothetical protein